jgi:hypothetical protein
LQACDPAGEVPIRGITTYEVQKRRKKRAPMGLIEVPDEARFSHISDFAIGIKIDDESDKFGEGCICE